MAFLKEIRLRSFLEFELGWSFRLKENSSHFRLSMMILTFFVSICCWVQAQLLPFRLRVFALIFICLVQVFSR